MAGTAGSDPDALVTTGQALVAIHDWTFLLGPGLMAGLNALLIGSVMYRSRLLPRWIPTLGLIGAPLLLISVTATLFGAWDQISGPALFLALPIAVWEFSFGVYMTFKGFRPTRHNESRPSRAPFASFAGGRRLNSLTDLQQRRPATIGTTSVPMVARVCLRPDTGAIIRLHSAGRMVNRGGMAPSGAPGRSRRSNEHLPTDGGCARGHHDRCIDSGSGLRHRTRGGRIGRRPAH